MDRSFLKESWDGVMSLERNPLQNLPLATAHLVMQVLSWMWSVIFSLAVGSYLAFGITVLAHALVLAGVFVTLAVFRVARDQAPMSDTARGGGPVPVRPNRVAQPRRPYQ